MASQRGDSRGRSEVSREAESAADRLLPHWIQVVRGEYLEIPGLRLTRSQVQRLWGLASDECDAVIWELVAAGFLKRTPGGAYIRADSAQA